MIKASFPKSIRRIKWFTLVELIVVTTILAILWTVGYLSYAWYAASSRDSVRVTDISTIKRGIGIYFTEKSDYPNPSNPKLVTYSGAGLWNEGTFGDAAFLQTRVTTPPKGSAHE